MGKGFIGGVERTANRLPDTSQFSGVSEAIQASGVGSGGGGGEGGGRPHLLYGECLLC